ncbi:DNA-protecting protein DprA [Knoellia locipacati]|uniref:DNA-processing protein DprA n=1 Tax=Knoellia locipacati TaxID=882824 RepID=UPI00385037BF
MDDIRTAGVILAALELTPAEPSDVTAILLRASDRQVLLRGDGEGCAWSPTATSRITPRDVTPLARYLADHMDRGRIEHWTKIIDRGASEGRYRPLAVMDVDYPSRLRAAWDAPPLLFCSLAETDDPLGAASGASTMHGGLNARLSLAIVGSRQTSPQLQESTERVAADLAVAGVGIVSGLAAGIDAAAHRGALAVGGYTVAVMGTGIDLVFPESNRHLATEIRRVGTLVSQFAPPAPRTRTSFLRRNHVIAAMSDASLLMDANERSGSRYEVEQALDYGRPVLAWAPALGHQGWVQELVKTRGVRLVESAAEVSQYMARSGHEGGA